MSASNAFIPRPASRTRVERHAVYEGLMTQRAYWVYLLVGLAFFVVLFLVARDHMQNVHAWARVPCWLSNPLVLSVITLAVIGFAAHATAIAHRLTPTSNWAAGVGGLYIGALVVLVVAAWLAYRAHNFVGAFYASLVLVVLSIAHFMAVWKWHRGASLAVLPLVLYSFTILYFLWYMADESSDCSSTCGPVYQVVLKV